MSDARPPQSSTRESETPHHDLPREAARPVQRTRLRDAMSAARMAPVVSDPWAELRGDRTETAARSAWGAARDVGVRPPDEQLPRRPAVRPDAVIDLTDGEARVEAGHTRSERDTESSVQSAPVVPTRNDALAALPHYGLGSSWGSRWAASTQGWVRAPDGTVVWRPVVATTQQLDLWDTDRYLGVVTAEVATTVEGLDDRDLTATLARARQSGMRALVGEAVERGAHGVVGLTIDYTAVGPRMIVTMNATAVTLREKRT